MKTYRTPGVYVQTLESVIPPITGVRTGTAGFVGVAAKDDGRDRAVLVTGWGEFVATYGYYSASAPFLAPAVHAFFLNGGKRCYIVNVADHGYASVIGSGLQALAAVDEVSIVCLPGQTDPGVQKALIAHCETLRDRFCILDAQQGADAAGVRLQRDGLVSDKGFGALYYPWVVTAVETLDTAGNVVTETMPVPPGGAVAGIYARCDTEKGVHKAPANEPVRGVTAPERTISAAEEQGLNPRGINCIRLFPGRGIRVWGARTLAPEGSEWKYVNVRRLFLFLEESVERGTRWAAFEPNGEMLWRRTVQSVSDFLYGLWRAGMLAGMRPDEAFFVRCDRSTMTQNDIDSGRLVIQIGVAPVKPAEFVILRIGQRTADAGK